MIPECYRVKGLASPFLYKKKTGAPVAESTPKENQTAENAVQAAAAMRAAEEAAKVKAEMEAKAKANNATQCEDNGDGKLVSEREAKKRDYERYAGHIKNASRTD